MPHAFQFGRKRLKVAVGRHVLGFFELAEYFKTKKGGHFPQEWKARSLRMGPLDAHVAFHTSQAPDTTTTMGTLWPERSNLLQPYHRFLGIVCFLCVWFGFFVCVRVCVRAHV